MKNKVLSTAKWLTSESEISSAETLSLLRGLLTADGKGADFKLHLLCELLDRENVKNLLLYVTD
jgi:hypothetical protein